MVMMPQFPAISQRRHTLSAAYPPPLAQHGLGQAISLEHTLVSAQSSLLSAFDSQPGTPSASDNGDANSGFSFLLPSIPEDGANGSLIPTPSTTPSTSPNSDSLNATRRRSSLESRYSSNSTSSNGDHSHAHAEGEEELKDSEDSSASVKRSRLTREQTSVLKRVYSLTYFPDKATKEQLSKELNIPVRTIQIWFQNQRQYHRLKMKKKALQQQGSNASAGQKNVNFSPSFANNRRNSCPATFQGASLMGLPMDMSMNMSHLNMNMNPMGLNLSHLPPLPSPALQSPSLHSPQTPNNPQQQSLMAGQLQFDPYLTMPQNQQQQAHQVHPQQTQSPQSLSPSIKPAPIFIPSHGFQQAESAPQPETPLSSILTPESDVSFTELKQRVQYSNALDQTRSPFQTLNSNANQHNDAMNMQFMQNSQQNVAGVEYLNSLVAW